MMFKKAIALGLICCKLLILSMCCSASTTISDNTYSYALGIFSTDAYAWTDKYLFVLHGAFEDVDDWMATYYSLIRKDRVHGDCDIIMSNIYGSLRKVFIYRDKLMLISANKEGINLIVADFDGDIIEEIDFDLNVSNSEYLLYKDSIYFACKEGIYEISLENYSLNKLYTSLYKIENSRDYKPFIYSNHLYFIEDTDIKAYNLDSKEVDITIKANLPTNQEFLKVFKEPLLPHQFTLKGYPYVIINNVLYYFDSELMSTVSIRIDQPEEEKILKRIVFFRQFDNNGCLAVFLYEDKFQTIYYKYEEIDKEDFSFQEERGIVMPDDTCLVGYNEYILYRDCHFYSEFGGNIGYLDLVIIPLYDLPL